jgi:uncharacterized spore protein YtfJ
MAKIGFIMKPEIDTIIGKPLEVHNKILYPVIRISILRNDNNDILGSWIVPIAIVVEENAEKYVIPILDENIDFDEVLKMLPVQ